MIEGGLRLVQEHRDTVTTRWEETDFPLLNIFETEEAIIVDVELPGVAIEDLEVSLSSGSLVIEGVKRELLEAGRVNFLCMERSFGIFRRIVPLLHPIDTSRITARMSLGILKVTIPRMPERRGLRKTVPIAVE